MSSQHDPLYDHDQQQRAQEHGERIELADLSATEREALALLRRHPRVLSIFADLPDVSKALWVDVRGVQASLLNKRLIKSVDGLIGFVVLTDDGARLQAELFAEGGAS